MNKTATRNVLDSSIDHSPSELIKQLYLGLLSREPDRAGLSGYLELLHAGASIADVARSIVGSPEFESKHPQPSLPTIDADVGEFVINGHRMIVPLHDVVYFGSRTSGAYELHVSQTITNHLSSGGTFLDIGSNIGAHSIAASVKVGPRGTVFSVDASIENCAVLNKSIRCFGYGNILVMAQAVGASPSIENITIDDRSSNKVVRKEATENSLKIAVTTIDHLLGNIGKLDMIKIDVEGREAGVLIGAKEILRQSHCPVVAEYLGKDVAQYADTEGRFTDFLIQMGYTAFVIERDHSYTKLNGSLASFEAAVNAERADGGDHVDLLFKFA
jgi:FkbM family methyltransferase